MTLACGRLRADTHPMFPFVMTGVVDALLASFGAFFGEIYAAGSGSSRRLWAVLGAWAGPLLGVLGMLLAVAAELRHPSLNWESYGFIAAIWGVHWVLVSLAATGGVYLAYDSRSANRAYWGALLACLLAIPLTCWHLILLI